MMDVIDIRSTLYLPSPEAASDRLGRCSHRINKRSTLLILAPTTVSLEPDTAWSPVPGFDLYTSTGYG